MMYFGGPVPQWAQLQNLRRLFHEVRSASLDPVASRDLIHRLAEGLR